MVLTKELLENLDNNYKNIEKIYFHKTLLAYSKEKRKVEMLTISSKTNMEKETLDLRNPNVFPDNSEKPNL